MEKYENLYFQYTFKFLQIPPKPVWESRGVCMYLKLIHFQIFFNCIVKLQIILPTESKSGVQFSPSPTVFFYIPVPFIRILATDKKLTVGVGEKRMPDLNSVGKIIYNFNMQLKKIINFKYIHTPLDSQTSLEGIWRNLNVY